MLGKHYSIFEKRWEEDQSCMERYTMSVSCCPASTYLPLATNDGLPVTQFNMTEICLLYTSRCV